jgi:hypothetical protein
MKQDLEEFIDSIKEEPLQGVELYPGIRKIRLAITSKGRGKSGGARVITYTIIAAKNEGEIYLIDIYNKADYSTVDIATIKEVIAAITDLPD